MGQVVVRIFQTAGSEQRWPLVGRAEELEFVRQARRSGQRRGVILSGAAGVGKSRLAAEAAGEAQREKGWSTVAVRASAGLAGLPFGGLRAALDVTPTTVDLAGVSGAIETAFAAARGAGRLLVLVDDAHLLDEQSAGLLHSLVARGQATLLATMRSGLPAPAALTALWKDGLVERLEVQDLSRVELAELVTSALGAPVEDNTVERLWYATEGNPLYLREVILASLETGALRTVGQEWRWRGVWAQSNRLHEIVAERLGRLEPDELTAIEALAVGGPLPVELLADLALAHAVHCLEARSLVAVELSRARLEVSISHPVHSEVVRARVPALQARSICRNLVDAMRRLGADGPSDQVRLARWSMEAGLAVDPVSLVRAADATLWHIGEAIADRIQIVMPDVVGRPGPMATSEPDTDTAVRLTTTAWEAGGGVTAGATLAIALAWTGATREAESVLERLRQQTRDADDNLRIAVALSQLRFWGQRRIEDAIDTLASADRNAPAGADPTLRAQVLEDWAGIELNIGRPAAALERDPISRVARRRARIVARGAAGGGRARHARQGRRGVGSHRSGSADSGRRRQASSGGGSAVNGPNRGAGTDGSPRRGAPAGRDVSSDRGGYQLLGRHCGVWDRGRRGAAPAGPPGQRGSPTTRCRRVAGRTRRARLPPVGSGRPGPRSGGSW
jgi:hypothetical protein